MHPCWAQHVDTDGARSVDQDTQHGSAGAHGEIRSGQRREQEYRSGSQPDPVFDVEWYRADSGPPRVRR